MQKNKNCFMPVVKDLLCFNAYGGWPVVAGI